MRVSIFDVLSKYFNVSEGDFERQKGKWVGACPLHNETNGQSFLIYDKGDSQDWTCMGKCKTGGSIPHLLVKGKVAQTISEANKRLSEDFNLQPPSVVTFDNFVTEKDFAPELLEKLGIKDHIYYKDGEEARGLYFPLYDQKGDLIAEKIRIAYTGKQRFFYKSGDARYFGLQLLADYDRTKPLYLCEGETDTLAMLSCGYQAIGLLGSNGFEDLPSLVEGFTHPVLASDNDEAGMKLLMSMRDAFAVLYTLDMRRYSDLHEVYQYQRSALEHVAVPVAANIGAITATEHLSCGRTWESLLQGKSYLEALSVVEELKRNKTLPAKMINAAFKQFYKAPATVAESDRIYVKNGGYAVSKFVSGEVREEQVSNFTIHVAFTIRTDEGVVRVATLCNTEGSHSEKVYLTGQVLANANIFRETVISAGNYNWKGSNDDLVALVDLLQQSTGPIIDSPRQVGRLGDSWLMGSYGVDSTGAVVHADADGVVALDGKSFILSNINSDDDDVSGLPRLPSETDYDLSFVANTLRDNLGGYEAYLALGFCAAGWHSNELFCLDGERNYPIFFVAGKRNSGKSVLANWMMGSFGFSGESMGKSFSMPSVVSMTRKLSYYSSLPLWYDDYRNNIFDLQRRNGLLLGSYNRQGGDKATRTGFAVRTETLRGNLLLSGEDLPADNAVESRCCIISVSANRRDDSLKDAAFRAAEMLPAMGHAFLLDKQTNGSKALCDRVRKIQKDLESHGVGTRIAKNKAVFAGAFLHYFGEHITDEAAFLSWLATDTQEAAENVDQSHALSQFFDDMGVMIEDGSLKRGQDYQYTSGSLRFRMPFVYAKWDKNFKPIPFNKKTLLSYFRQEKELSEIVAKFDGRTSGSVKAWKVDQIWKYSATLLEAVQNLIEEEEI